MINNGQHLFAALLFSVLLNMYSPSPASTSSPSPYPSPSTSPAMGGIIRYRSWVLLNGQIVYYLNVQLSLFFNLKVFIKE